MIPRALPAPDGTLIPLTPMERLQMAIAARRIASTTLNADHYRTLLHDVASGKMLDKPTTKPR